MPNIELYFYVILFFASILGGFVGSMSGGAGMVTMPLLLLSGINPLQALATNKLQACVGSLTSAAHYTRSGLANIPKICLILAFVFATCGTISVQYIPLDLLSKILPFAMIAIGMYFLFSKKISDKDAQISVDSSADSVVDSSVDSGVDSGTDSSLTRKMLFYVGVSCAGFYGGLLGIGVGSFMLALLVGVGGYKLSDALGASRWIVFCANVAAMVFFTMSGNVLWTLGIIMCVGQSIGASFGVKMALKHGAKIVRPVVITICFALSIKLIFEEFL